ncbi:MAG: hypothetical protein QNK11_06690 [Legionella sp.]|nr:hypothetical protein [Legionella sp.]
MSEEDVCKGARFDFTTQKYLDIQIELLREALAGPTIPDDVEVSVLDEHDVIEVLNSSELKPSVPGTLCNRRHSNDNLFPPAAENELPLEPIDEGEEPSDGHTY